MYHYKARVYSPTLGRFMQTDPVGYDDQFNLYAYVGNDPIILRDPTGTRRCSGFIDCTVELAERAGRRARDGDRWAVGRVTAMATALGIATSTIVRSSREDVRITVFRVFDGERATQHGKGDRIMPRAAITRDGVLNAMAEFDALGRVAFLDRYGFNGARDYFVLHEGRRYDSKPIAAVAHRWAPGGGGRPLTALELSGGRGDAARRLRELGFQVTEPAEQRASDEDVVGAAVPGFRAAYARFLRDVAAVQNGEPFSGFGEGVAAGWEGYKPRLRARALDLLDPGGWKPSMVGGGEILRRTISAIEIQEDRINLTNNLVFWQNRFGHANRDHRALLEAVDRPALRTPLEQALLELFQGASEGAVFATLAELTGARYPLLAYLFFLRDMDRFLPIQPTGFDEAFRILGIDLVTLRHCGWDNYRRFNAAIEDVRRALSEVPILDPVRLIDAHSFCWLLVKLPQRAGAGRGVADPGRVLGARSKAIVNMRLSIERTVAQANGQSVLRTMKIKELMLDSRDLEALLERLLALQDNRCALTGIPFRFDGSDRCLLPSADRIDSQGHYAEGNIQIVCQFVNFWKSSTPDEEFRRLLDLVRQVEL